MNTPDDIQADDIQVVTFRVGPQEFAFDILQIERILRHEPPARLPQAPEFLEGVVQYGGGAVPVVDLRKRFELEAPIREETRLMIVDLGEQRVGVVVDEVREVLRVDSRPHDHHSQCPQAALVHRTSGAQRGGEHLR
jgi:purine-binding chemotaxis protein CheW